MSAVLSLPARRARLQALQALLDAGAPGAVAQVLLYPNAPPASPDSATAEPLIAAIPLAIPCAMVGDALGVATLTFTVPCIAQALRSGVIGWARFATAGNVAVLDALVSLPSAPSPAPVVLSDLQVYAGGEVQLLACQFTE